MAPIRKRPHPLPAPGLGFRRKTRGNLPEVCQKLGTCDVNF